MCYFCLQLIIWIKMFSFKNMSILCLFVWVSNVWGMDLVSAHKPKKKVLRAEKFKGIFFCSFNQLTDLCKNISPDEKEQIRHYLTQKKKTSTLFLFDVAYLVPDVRKIIGLTLLNNNADQTEKFLKKPIAHALDTYQQASAIDRMFFPYFFALSDSAQRPTILNDIKIDKAFELLDGIKLLDVSYRYNNKQRVRTCNQEELYHIQAVAKEFNLSYADVSFSYEYYDKYTLSNFIKNISAEQIQGTAFFAAHLIASMLVYTYPFGSVLDPEIDRQNKLNHVYNIALKSEYQRTGDSMFDIQHEIKDPYHCTFLDVLKLVVPYLISSEGIAFDIDFRSNDFSLLRLLGVSFLIVMAHVVMDIFLDELVLPLLTRDSSGHLMISGSIFAAYIIACGINNIKNMATLKTKKIKLQELDDQLHNSNIHIA